jgi:hypothetical protein
MRSERFVVFDDDLFLQKSCTSTEARAPAGLVNLSACGLPNSIARKATVDVEADFFCLVQQ